MRQSRDAARGGAPKLVELTGRGRGGFKSRRVKGDVDPAEKMCRRRGNREGEWGRRKSMGRRESRTSVGVPAACPRCACGSGCCCSLPRLNCVAAAQPCWPARDLGGSPHDYARTPPRLCHGAAPTWCYSGLRVYYYARDEKLLVYRYMPKRPFFLLSRCKSASHSIHEGTCYREGPKHDTVDDGPGAPRLRQVDRD